MWWIKKKKPHISGGPNVNMEHTYNHLSLAAGALLSSPFNDMDICQSTHSPRRSLLLIDDIWARPAKAIILRSDPTNHGVECNRKFKMLLIPPLTKRLHKSQAQRKIESGEADFLMLPLNVRGNPVVHEGGRRNIMLLEDYIALCGVLDTQ